MAWTRTNTARAFQQRTVRRPLIDWRRTATTADDTRRRRHKAHTRFFSLVARTGEHGNIETTRVHGIYKREHHPVGPRRRAIQNNLLLPTISGGERSLVEIFSHPIDSKTSIVIIKLFFFFYLQRYITRFRYYYAFIRSTVVNEFCQFRALKHV